MRVLVVVPTHDRTEFLDEALASLAAQTRKPDEVVVTGNVGPSFTHRYFCKYVGSEEPFHVRINNAIAASECESFILLSDDDMLFPQYIEKTTALMGKTGADIVYTGSNNEPITSLCTKAMWAKVGGFAHVPYFDWDFWWSCREAGALSLPIREHLWVYRRHPEQLARHAKDAADGTHAKHEAIILARHPKRGRP